MTAVRIETRDNNGTLIRWTNGPLEMDSPDMRRARATHLQDAHLHNRSRRPDSPSWQTVHIVHLAGARS